MCITKAHLSCFSFGRPSIKIFHANIKSGTDLRRILRALYSRVKSYVFSPYRRFLNSCNAKYSGFSDVIGKKKFSLIPCGTYLITFSDAISGHNTARLMFSVCLMIANKPSHD